MKKQLVKKVKKTQKAIHYFSSENLTEQIQTTRVNPRCSIVENTVFGSCGCSHASGQT